MPARNLIGEYLRARRELVRPEDVGFRDLGRRRTPGLRREEVAMLAGVSADYYVRLEQGGISIPRRRCSMPSRAPCSWTRTPLPISTVSRSRRRRDDVAAAALSVLRLGSRS